MSRSDVTIAETGQATEAAWQLLRSAAGHAAVLEREGVVRAFTADDDGRLLPATERSLPVLVWQPEAGWQLMLPPTDPRSGFLSLYLPVCSASVSRPLTIGHLGQSLDGFIGTHSGDSQFVTGEANLAHMHRLRALCDAVVVGAGTVAADDPRLTTRLVPGPNPLRVIVDPERRLAPTARVFVDRDAPTLYFCGRSRVGVAETHVGVAAIVGVDEAEDGSAPVAPILAALRTRGCARVFVEGGGVTVSAFLSANLLDRLHITVAPVLIGDGRRAIRLARADRLADCRRPAYRVFRMGGDVLFDCDLRSSGTMNDASDVGVARVI